VASDRDSPLYDFSQNAESDLLSSASARNHSPLFAPVPKPTIETDIEAITLAVLSVFDQHAGGK
jgi:hypothetical protein